MDRAGATRRRPGWREPTASRRFPSEPPRSVVFKGIQLVELAGDFGDWIPVVEEGVIEWFAYQFRTVSTERAFIVCEI